MWSSSHKVYIMTIESAMGMHQKVPCSSALSWKWAQFNNFARSTQRCAKFHSIHPTNIRYEYNGTDKQFKGFTAIVSKVATSLLLLYSLHYLQLSIHEQPDSDSHLLVMKGYSYILVLFSSQLILGIMLDGK